MSDISNKYIDDSLDFITIKEKPKKEGKSLTPDQKRLHWEAYAQKTAREEVMFKRVFDNVFDEQKNQAIEQLEKTGQVSEFNDEKTAQRFEPAIELVYHSAFDEAV